MRRRPSQGQGHGSGGSVYPTYYTLTVTLVNTGVVTSDDGLIDTSAGRTSGSYVAGSVVVLSSTPTTTWSGDGTGTTTRTVMMSAAKAITATFATPSGTGVIDGTGSVLFVDDSSVQNITTAGWDNVNDSFINQAAWTTGDGQITQETTSPDTHQRTDGSTSSHFRRFRTSDAVVNGDQTAGATLTVQSISGRNDIPSDGYCSVEPGDKKFHHTGKTNTSFTGCTDEGGFTGTITDGSRVAMQSIYDAPRNIRTRTQAFVPGGLEHLRGQERIYRVPIRCNGHTSLLNDTAAGSSQMLQWKMFPNSDLVWAIVEKKTKWELQHQTAGGGAGSAETLATITKTAGHQGDWILWQFAQKFETQANGGYLQVWADLTGDGVPLDLTGQINTTIMYAGYTYNVYSHGEYQQMAGAPGLIRDYGWLEVCNFTHP